MRAFRLLLVVLALLPAASWAVGDGDQERKKIGLALSGGGARGSAHIGVLRALEELGVQVDYIAGTSMGAIIGGLYASGYSASDIEGILNNMDWEGALVDRPARVDRTMRTKQFEAEFMVPYRVGFNNGGVQLPLGLIEGQHLDQVLREVLLPVISIHDFDRLPIPFRAIATDLVSGEEVVLAGGSLPDSLRASMSVPGVFAPVSIDDRLLVDGGMSNNLPVGLLHEMGADVVIAVDISSQLLTREKLRSVLNVTEQLSNFLVRRTTESQIERMGPDDVLIVPDLGDFSSADFMGSVEIIEIGYVATMASRAELSALATVRERDRVAPADREFTEYVAHFLELENDSVLHDEIILARLPFTPGEAVDLKELDRSVDRVYSLDVFKSVTYDLVENEAGESGIVVRAVPREWGPNYMQFGLELLSDFSGNSDFQLGAAYTRNALNGLGGELRVTGTMGRKDELDINFYQPVDSAARWFVEPEVHWTRENYDLWLDGINLAELELAGWGMSFSVGRNFDTRNRLRLAYGFSRGEADIVTGNPGLVQDGEIEIGELELQYIHDSLNSIWFPTEGMMHRLEYLYADESLGASTDFSQATVNGAMLLSLGKNTALLNYELGYSFDDEAPVERWYRLGGLGRLSGLVPDQLLGRHVALASLAYYYRLNDLEVVSTFAGFTLEAGNVWNFADDISLDGLHYSGSLFLGVDSPLGPAYFAVGYGDSGELAAYFYLGNPFRVRRFE